MNEYETIAAIASRFRKCGDQVNRPFDSDAEFVRIGDAIWGMTIDDFSPAEDLFASEDPIRLGANLAAATLSDLLAAGVRPRFFLHALSLPRSADPAFVRSLCDGIAGALDRAGCALCGGDMGSADPWRYTGFAMGPVASPSPLMRRLPAAEQSLWTTGSLGDFNVAALKGGATPCLELRMSEAELARSSALAGTDTSGGLADALWMMHIASPGMSIDIDLPSIPYAAGVREACAAMDVPVEAALMGGAGEYELLFSFACRAGDGLPIGLREAGFSEIGRAYPSAGGGVCFIAGDGRRLQMKRPPPCPRSAASPAEHALEAVAAAIEILGARRDA